jgi:hypothetical protein
MANTTASSGTTNSATPEEKHRHEDYADGERGHQRRDSDRWAPSRMACSTSFEAMLRLMFSTHGRVIRRIPTAKQDHRVS